MIAPRNFLELQINFIRHASTPGRAMSRSEWQQSKCVVADHLSQHQTQLDTYLATMLEKKARALH